MNISNTIYIQFLDKFLHPSHSINHYYPSLTGLGSSRKKIISSSWHLYTRIIHPIFLRVTFLLPPFNSFKTNWKRRDTRRLESTRNHGSDKSRVAPINVVIRKWRVWNARNNKSGPLSGGARARAGSTLLINIRQSNIHNVMEAA